MKVTGYLLMDRIKELKELAADLDSQFNPSLMIFANERGKKPDPRNLMREYVAVEDKLARLQSAQSQYNLAVTVTVQGETLLLETAVKLAGSVGRVKNHWKTASQTGSQGSPYGYGQQNVRAKEHEYAEPVLSPDECRKLMAEANRRVRAFTQAIRSGNAQEIDLDLDPRLFE